MWFNAPIYDSQFNNPAKLYKRLTNDVPIKVEDGKIIQVTINKKTFIVGDNGIITVQDNRYVLTGSLQWVDATDKQDGEYQPIDGLIVRNEYMTIKFNGLYRCNPQSLSEPQVGDLLKIDSELWIIESPIQRVRHRAMRNMATVYLQLRKVM